MIRRRLHGFAGWLLRRTGPRCVEDPEMVRLYGVETFRMSVPAYAVDDVLMYGGKHLSRTPIVAVLPEWTLPPDDNSPPELHALTFRFTQEETSGRSGSSLGVGGNNHD